MKRILLTIDDETANLLDGEVNRSETIRNAVHLYKRDILPDTVEGFRSAFIRTNDTLDKMQSELKEIESILSYISSQLK